MLLSPPKTIYDTHGQIEGIILSYEDYQTFLRLLARHTDWETLPSYLQDAIDNLLADEAEAEQGELISLETLEVIIHPRSLSLSKGSRFRQAQPTGE